MQAAALREWLISCGRIPRLALPFREEVTLDLILDELGLFQSYSEQIHLIETATAPVCDSDDPLSMQVRSRVFVREIFE